MKKEFGEKVVLIETERLVIRLISDDEMMLIIEKQCEEDMITAYQEMLKGSLEHPDEREWYAIWMIERKDKIPVGELSFKGKNDNGSVEIGYGIIEEYQNLGYATEAVEGVVTWALGQPGVIRVEAETGTENMASQHVLKKCGFVSTGIIGEEGPRFAKMN